MGFLRRRAPDEHASTAPATDADALLVAWAQRNPQAFTALYDRYFPAVYGYCLSQLGSPEAAEDAASQTFLKALAALPGYREAGRFRPWLFAIAHNAVIDARRDQRAGDPLETAVDIVDPGDSPEERAIAALAVARLEDALARLPSHDRHILELRRAGLSGREIAEMLGIGHEAAKKRQLRAMDRLRTDLADSLDVMELRHGA
jgi:RNA polymerase sigma factor (sigma-70 family)